MAFQFCLTTARVLSASLFAVTLFSCGQTKQPDSDIKFTNSLIHETSPYLLQHAHNPVDWRPWGTEAFKKAEDSGKLVIVSIGYSSCHWCHVMEEESFENEEVAKLMNQYFVSIKVDREERPDVDQVYMTAAQLLTGSGGWPLNVITLPDGKPIYAGTYHPTTEWTRVLKELHSLYEKSPNKAREYANNVSKGIQSVNLVSQAGKGQALTKEILGSGVGNWKKHWDLKWGGNVGRFKFMLPANLNFLMDYATLAKDEQALAFVKTSLDKMATGGVNDQVGGGFYRYSTDPKWRIPHFEKMLYDNAQLISLYSKGYALYKEPGYRDVVLQITKFLDREMKHPEGAYFAAMDADSEGEEGRYYVWTKDYLQQILGEGFTLFASYYNLDSGKAWEDGKYVLNRPASDSEFLAEQQISSDELKIKKQQWQDLLLAKRQKRVPPRIDDKIITSWNALLISGFTDAYEAFGEVGFLNRAQSVMGFLEAHNMAQNKLLHSYKDGSKKMEGFLEDYSFLVKAYLDLYESAGENAYLKKARDLMSLAEKLFNDQESGLYRFKEDDELIAKIIQTDDGVIPSANAVMAQNLFQMGHIIYDTENIRKAEVMLSTVLLNMEQSLDNYAQWGSLMLNMVYPYYEVAVVGPEANGIHKELQEKYLPNSLILVSTEESDMPLFKNRYVKDGTYIYVCQNHSCKLPVTKVSDALEQLGY